MEALSKNQPLTLKQFEMKKLIILTCLGMLLSVVLTAQSPDWEQPTGYQYSKNFTGVLVMSGEESRDENDKVAAFVDGEVRGVAQPVYESNNDRYYVFLTVFSQQASGEEMTFRMYDASADELSNALDTVDFENNGSSGTISSPTVFRDNHTPTAIEVSTDEVFENTAVGDTVLTFTTVDEDADDSFTYELVEGADATHNFLFAIEGHALLYDSLLDFEAFDSKELSIRVRTTDSHGESVEEVIALQLMDTNDPPTGIVNVATSEANGSFAEHADLGTEGLVFRTEDQDARDSYTYELVDGVGSTHNDLVAISGSSLQLAADINYEDHTDGLSIRVRSTDSGGLQTETVFTLDITDINDAPVSVVINLSTIDENLPEGDVVATLQTEDEDAVDQFTYSLVAGEGDADNELFTIAGDQLKVAALIDYETNPVINVRLQSTDKDGEQVEGAFEWQVNDLNDRPIRTHVSETRIAFDVEDGDIIAKFSTDDEDEADTFSYAFVEGTNDNDLFRIESNRLLANADFASLTGPFETEVRTTDARGLTIDSVYVFSLASIALSNQSLAENEATGTVIGQFSTAGSGNYTYTLLSGKADNDRFSIDQDQLLSAQIFDFEERSTFEIWVRSTGDNGFASERSFTIAISDANDPPEQIELSENTIDENLEPESLVGVFTTLEQDKSDTYTYVLTAGDDFFTIEGAQLKIRTPFNFEEQDSYPITVKTTDAGGLSTTADFVISVIDQPDAPDDLLVSNLSIDENAAAGTIVGELSTVDQDANSTFIYQLSGVDYESNEAFYIQGNRLIASRSFDYETKNALTIKLSTTDHTGLVLEKDFVVNVQDANEAPTISIQEFEVLENSESGTLIGTLQASDIDAGQSLTFSLKENEPAFSLAPNGDLTVADQQALDYETRDFYSLQVTVTDDGTPALTNSTWVQVFVTDELEEGILPVNNFLSPNSDSKNDYFEIENVSLYAGYVLTIYNQNGSEVFRSEAYANDWAGTNQSGEPLAPGTYYYRFEHAENPINYRGTLTIAK